MKDVVKRNLRIVFIAMVGSLVMTYLSCSSCAQDWKKFAATTFFSGVMWVVMWVGNGELAHAISNRISWLHHPVKRLVVGVVSTVIFTVVVAIGLLKSWEFARGIQFRSYNDFIILSLVITFLISLFLHGREFLLNWRKLELDAAKLRNENLSSRYESLKSQVDPHFLFNSLNVLTNLVYEDADKSAKFIKQLSDVYRYVLDTRNKELVSVDEELKFVNAYLYLQQIRFGDKLMIENRLDGVKGMVPPLALQMLAENAIKHNIVSEENPLRIKLYQANDTIVVENNLQRKSVLNEAPSGIGLENIKKRYEFLSQKAIDISEADGVFKVTVPLLEWRD